MAEPRRPPSPRMRLSPEEERRTRAALVEAPREALIRFMTDRQFGLPEAGANEAGRAAAIDLGWLDPATGGFTVLGGFAADSCREWRFWAERDRRLPFETGRPPLAAAHFAGKTVIEIGSGMGANLMSLQGVAGRALGVEPIEVYRQIGDLLREAEGLPSPEIRIGSGEAIPVADGEADAVLCVTAHQYMDVRAAFADMARVLRPGGELVVIGNTLGVYAKDALPAFGAGAAGLRAYLVTIANTLGYMAAGRRPIPPRGPGSTTRPVYPTADHVTRLLRAAGLDPAAPFRIGPETCFIARKPGG